MMLKIYDFRPDKLTVIQPTSGCMHYFCWLRILFLRKLPIILTFSYVNLSEFNDVDMAPLKIAPPNAVLRSSIICVKLHCRAAPCKTLKTQFTYNNISTSLRTLMAQDLCGLQIFHVSESIFSVVLWFYCWILLNFFHHFHDKNPCWLLNTRTRRPTWVNIFFWRRENQLMPFWKKLCISWSSSSVRLSFTYTNYPVPRWIACMTTDDLRTVVPTQRRAFVAI